MKHLTIIIIDPDNRAGSETAVTLQNAGFNCAVFSDIGDCERQLETIGVGCIVVSLAFGKEKISEFVSKIVTNKRYRHIPLVGILADDPEAYLKLGNCRHDFFHFLEASPSAHALTQVVESGFSSYEHYVSLVSEIRSRTSAIGLITSGTFHLKSPKECENLTTMLSLACPDPSAVALGLSELLINAVEHGNLGKNGSSR